jgi:hypothetical protein
MPLPKVLLDGDERLGAFAKHGKLARSEARFVVGWREWAGLPRLGIARVKAKIDTGARTSALHANSIEFYESDGEPWVRFDVAGEGKSAPWHEARVADRRSVRSSNGGTELRFVIRTELALGGRAWAANITLTNRERMELPMLIGREALAGRVLVDAERSWLCGQPVFPKAEKPKPVRRKQPARLGEGR